MSCVNDTSTFMKIIRRLQDKQTIFSIVGILLILLIIWNGLVFYDLIKKDEQQRMEIFTEAYQSLNKSENDLSLELKIIKNNNNIPIVITNDKDSILNSQNLPGSVKNDSKKIRSYLEDIRSESNKLTVNVDEGKDQYIYYGESSILTRIKWYPLILLVIILLFSALAYYFYSTSKSSEQNKLWAGMAKETAHQIGTPLSSLMGWVELLKTEENVNQDYVEEIKKDVDRLQTISQRFSKVGSQIELKKTDIVKVTTEAVEYLKNRSSSLIEFEVDMPEREIFIPLNVTLYSWTIENLTKNATDAMSGKGKLKVGINDDHKCVKVFITDTGKGIATELHKKIFEPGYTEKKRGWGLGLSLAKRIIKDYHDGNISVHKSAPGKGTTMMIRFKK